jgi:uncharacterized protein
MNRVVHFEIHSSDVERSQAFFEKAFGWKFTKWNGPAEYWLVDTGDASKPGINGGFMRSRDDQPRTVNTVQVDSVDETAKKVAASGGTVVVPKMPIPGVGWLAYATDPTGNLIGFMQADSNAK